MAPLLWDINPTWHTRSAVRPFQKHLCHTFISILQLELLVEPPRSSLDAVVDGLGLGALTLSGGLLATGLAANDFRDGVGPLLGGDALIREVLLHC